VAPFLRGGVTVVNNNQGGHDLPNTLAVNVVSPADRKIFPATLCLNSGGCTLQGSVDLSQAPEYFLSPGWIDLHAHVYHGVGNLSIPADLIGIKTGVHLIADAGSAGEETLLGFSKYVAPTCETAIRAWLNISSIGLAFMPEVSDIALMDVGKTIKTANDNRPFVCGIKVRAEKTTVGALGIQPVKLAVAAARATGLPLMVHIGAPPPNIEDILDLLITGDVVTHCYHGKACTPWQSDGRPIPALQKALDRGVLMDVGHGVTSFDFEIARKSIAAGFPPFCISTDAHSMSVGGTTFDLPTTMTKMLASGMSLIDVISGVTLAPAKVLKLKNWCDLSGDMKRATLFKLNGASTVGRIYADCAGKEIVPENYVVPSAVITEKGFKWLNR
jgi:dihydroorotase